MIQERKAEEGSHSRKKKEKLSVFRGEARTCFIKRNQRMKDPLSGARRIDQMSLLEVEEVE